jgi:hypothetical protein
MMTPRAFLTDSVTKSAGIGAFSDTSRPATPALSPQPTGGWGRPASAAAQNAFAVKPAAGLSQKPEILSGSRIVADVFADLGNVAALCCAKALQAGGEGLWAASAPIRRWRTRRRSAAARLAAPPGLRRGGVGLEARTGFP